MGMFRHTSLLSWSDILKTNHLRGAVLDLFQGGFHSRAVVRKRYYSPRRNLLILKLVNVKRKRWLTRDEWALWMPAANFRILTNYAPCIITQAGEKVYRFTLPRADHAVLYMPDSSTKPTN